MWKIIGGVVLGVFIGAMAVEIINRAKPDLLRDIEDKAEKAVQAFREAFREGYKQREVKA